MPVPLIVNGAAGRMGGRIIALALERPQEFRVVAGVDQKAGTLRALGHASDAPVHDQLPNERGAVVIDFSHHTAFYGLAQKCGAAGMPLVSGTTGIPPAQLEDGLAAAAKSVAAMHAMNYSVGVNVVFQVAAQIAKTLGLDYDIEVVEAHHNQKKDAPSGTAYGITDAICAATGRTRSDLVQGREGQVGARRRGEIGVHALRMGDVVGDHTAYFVGNGERIMLGHLAHNRDIFAGGALRAAAFVHGRAPGRYHMRDVLG
ncbi:MAG: 4-hydroxy-tetrahydrodipicolinate reductase, partial [Planctomycetes bacterium]|nr:4-hydroxy-tetrahydrodipicolinate reductase [Planctomycetota bacterium]